MQPHNQHFTHKIQFGDKVYDGIKVSQYEYKIYENNYELGKIEDNGICWTKRTMFQTQAKPYHQVIIISIES